MGLASGHHPENEKTTLSDVFVKWSGQKALFQRSDSFFNYNEKYQLLVESGATLNNDPTSCCNGTKVNQCQQVFTVWPIYFV